MNIFKKIPCHHCTKEFSKHEIKSDGLCESCFKHACFLFSIFNYGYKELLQMMDNSDDRDEIFLKYELLFDFAQRELKPWYSCNCIPQMTLEDIKTFQENINRKLFNQRNVSLNSLKSK